MGVCDSRTGRSTAIAHLKASQLIIEQVLFLFSKFAGLAGEMVFLGGVLGLVVPSWSFLDRFTPNLFGRRDNGTFSCGISSWFGPKKMFGPIRLTPAVLGHFQTPSSSRPFSDSGNDIFLYPVTDSRMRPNQVDNMIDNGDYD